MENFDEEWIAELKRQAAHDIQYAPLDQQMTFARQDYNALRNSLPPDQREILDNYFYLSRQMEIAMTRFAYLIGIQHGKKRALQGQ